MNQTDKTDYSINLIEFVDSKRTREALIHLNEDEYNHTIRELLESHDFGSPNKVVMGVVRTVVFMEKECEFTKHLFSTNKHFEEIVELITKILTEK